MDRQGAETDHPNNGNGLGNMRDGTGRGSHGSPGSSRKWISSEARVGSSAGRLMKENDVGGKSELNDEGGSSPLEFGSPSVSNDGASANSRTSGKVYSEDHRSNQVGGVKVHRSSSSSIRISPSSGAGGSGAKYVVSGENSFVVYLPQDDAVVAGLGEWEGGIDASETQEATDLLNEQLSALLRLPTRQFWKKVATDKSLCLFLDSYLHFRRRWFDNPRESSSRLNVGVVTGDEDLSRRVFMVLLRMSSNHDPGTPANESFSAKEHAIILKERKLLDVPKLMDVAAIYGHDNEDLARHLVSNAFKSMPGYAEEMAAYVLPLLQRIMIMHQRCCATVQAMKNPGDRSTVLSKSSVDKELLEIVDYLNDVVITLNTFVRVYPPAAKILVSSGNPKIGQGLLLPVLATLHDTLLPNLQEGFGILADFTESPQPNGGSHPSHLKGVAATAQSQLVKLGERLVLLSWRLIECCYFRGPPGDSEKLTQSGFLDLSEDAVSKGVSLVQAVVALATGLSQIDYITLGKLSSGVARLKCTGALLQIMERRHGIYNHIQQACRNGLLVLDDAQQAHLSALMIDDQSPTGEHAGAPGGLIQSVPRLTLPDKEVDEETVIQRSKISQIKDLFPDYGDGFIDACLEVYDNDPEKVIERILEGTLHPDIVCLDTSLNTKPIGSVRSQTLKDKGKGKQNEVQPITKINTPSTAPTLNDKGKGKYNAAEFEERSKSTWEEKSVLTRGPGSSSSVAGSSRAGGGSPEETSAGHEVSNVRVGRYVRREKGHGSFNELLDSRSDNEELRMSIMAAAAQMEYDDEYDDSFDELGQFVADTGAEETESLADLIGSRGRVKDENLDFRIQSKPSLLSPWGSGNPRDKKHPVGTFRGNSEASRSHFEPHRSSLDPRRSSFESQKPSMVPEVERQGKDSPADLAPGQGRGSRGRGRGKRREPVHKSQFYLKEGKLYSYKVPGAIGVSSVEEAEALKRESETIFGLGAGGNVPMTQSEGNTPSNKSGQAGILGDGGTGRTGYGRGRGTLGNRGSFDNHHRKDRATKKHFGGLGGF